MRRFRCLGSLGVMVSIRDPKNMHSHKKKLNQAGFEFKTTLISELLCCHGHFHFYDFFLRFTDRDIKIFFPATKLCRSASEFWPKLGFCDRRALI